MFSDRILYLGIDAPPGVFHYPVISTKIIESPELSQALSLWNQFTHLLFTSKNGVRHWPREIFGKIVIAIGEATAEEIRKRGVDPLVANEATQEGVIALLESLDLQNAYILYPRSKLARPHLRRYLEEKGLSHYAFDLYDTLFQKPEPKPDLDAFDEIIFTSPSTVEAFFRIFPSVPRRIILTAIGPVTKRILENRSL